MLLRNWLSLIGGKEELWARQDQTVWRENEAAACCESGSTCKKSCHVQPAMQHATCNMQHATCNLQKILPCATQPCKHSCHVQPSHAKNPATCNPAMQLATCNPAMQYHACYVTKPPSVRVWTLVGEKILPWHVAFIFTASYPTTRILQDQSFFSFSSVTLRGPPPLSQEPRVVS